MLRRRGKKRSCAPGRQTFLGGAGARLRGSSPARDVLGRAIVRLGGVVRWGVVCGGVVCGGVVCGGLASDGTLDADPDSSEPGFYPEDRAPEARGGASGSGSGARGSSDGFRIRPRRETCDDNPLLAECSQGGQAGVSSSGLSCAEDSQQPFCPQPTAPVLNLDDLPVRRQVEEVLGAFCGRCHTPGPAVVPGPADVRDLERMMQEGFIEDCSPDAAAQLSRAAPRAGRHRRTERLHALAVRGPALTRMPAARPARATASSSSACSRRRRRAHCRRHRPPRRSSRPQEF